MRETHARLAATHRQAAGDVVAVADEGQGLSGQRADQLAQRVQIGQGLARMIQVRQAVNDRAFAELRQLDQLIVALGADDHHVDVFRQDAAEVGHALARAPADVVSQEQAMAAEVDDACLEADARVRSDGFSKSKAITRPGKSGSRRPF